MTNEQAVRQFNSQVWPYLSAVLRLAQILTNDRTEAEDLAQETMLKAFASLASFRPGTDLRAWLFTILRNLRIDRLRSAKRSAGTVSLDQAQIDVPAPPGPASDPQAWRDPEALLEALSDQQVIDGLNQLPEEIRWTLLLVDVEGLELQQASEILQVPVGTVKSRCHRGRKMLRQTLTPLAKELRLVDTP